MAGGGVGEAMLIGAAVGATAGGAGAAIQGGDPLKGALTGGAMGAVGGGLGAGFGAGAGAVEGGTAGAVEGGTAGATTGAGTSSIGLGATGATNTGIGSIYSGAAPSIQGATNVGAGISGAGTGGGYGVTAGAGGSAGIGGAPVLNTISAPTTAGSIGGAGAGATTGTVGGATGAGTNIFGQTLGQPGVLSNTALGMTAGTAGLSGAMQAERGKYGIPPNEKYSGPLSKLKYDPNNFTASTPTYAPDSVYRPTYAAQGGIMSSFRSGGIDTNTVADYDDTSGTDDLNAGGTAQYNKGGVTHFDLGGMAMGVPSSGQQQQQQAQSYGSGIDTLIGNKKRMMTKEQMDAIAMQGMSKPALRDVYGQMAAQGLAKGGMSDLGSYSDGGRMLKGPGDGMSDNIPATIGGKQPARLADGEFVIPADVVSHLGNGSTDAGAKQLYEMMNRVRKARTGNSKQGKQIKPAKYMAA